MPIANTTITRAAHGAVPPVDEDHVALVTVVALPGGASHGSSLAASLARQTMPRWTLSEAGGADASGSWAGRLNAAVEAAKTEFVYLASPRATLHPTLLEKCFWFIATHPLYSFVNSHEVRHTGGGEPELFSTAFYDPRGVLECHRFGLHAMMRRGTFLELGGLNPELESGAAIWDFWLRAAEANHWGSTIAERLVERRAGQEDGDPATEEIAAYDGRARATFPRLFAGHVPVIETRWPKAFEPVRLKPPGSWKTGTPRGSEQYPEAAATRPPRMMLILPWMCMGGADKFNLDLCRLLKARGWDLTIASTAPAKDEWRPLFQQYTQDIFQPHHFLHWADYPVLLRSLIHAREPDVVLISNSELAYHILPYFRSYCPEPLYVDYVHMEEEHWKSGGHARHSAGLHDQLDLTMVTSEHLKAWLVERGAEPERVVNCPIGVDHARWRPDAALRARVRAELGVADDVPLILHAGRICAQKQPAVLARTFQSLHRAGRRFQAIVAGGGDDAPWLEQFLRDHGLQDTVRMLGDQSPERVRELMAAADVFFLPSQWEGVALVLYEAMASGVAFVGAQVGGQGEVAPADTAVLISAADSRLEPQAQAEVYAARIGELLENTERREAMTRAARRRIEERYSLEQMIDVFLKGIGKAKLLQRSSPRQAITRGMAQEQAARAVELLRLEWQVGHIWKERDYWKAAATNVAPVNIADANAPGAGKGAIKRILRALRSPSNVFRSP